MNVAYAFLIIMALFTVGDIISTKSKAVIPGMFVASVLMLVGFWTGLPKDIGDLSGIGKTIGSLSTYLIVANMGTTIRIKQLKKQWRTITIAFLGMLGLTAGIMFIGTLFIDKSTAVVATPVLAGGLVAALIMEEAAIAKGLPALAALAVLVLVTQSFFGMPVASLCLKKEGKRLIEGFRKMSPAERSAQQEAACAEEEHRLIPSLPKEYLTDNVLLFQLAILAAIAVFISNLTGGAIPKTIMCLFMGIIGVELGVVEPRALQRSKSSGFVMVIQIMYILSGLKDATPAMVASMIVPLLIVVVTGVLGLGLVSVLVGKKLGYSPSFSFAIGLNALLGFPPNYLITNDVATALGETPEEKDFLMAKMLPDMLIAGFATVTVGSVVLAGFMAKLL